jgi:uncharacterized phage protein gp47/JayE
MAITKIELPRLTDLRDKTLNTIRRLKIAAGVTRPNVAPGSESFIKAEAFALGSLEVHARLAALQDAQMPDSATGEDLDRLAMVLRGLERSSGAGASGYAKVACTGTVTYAAGAQCAVASGLRYEVVVTTVATNGTLVQIRGVDTGTRTNQTEGTILTWSSPPSGSSSAAEVGVGGLTAGSDAESDDKLRTRLMDALRHPAASGSWADYAEWAEDSTSAIEKAFIFPAYAGPGTVAVALIGAADASTYYTREVTAANVNTAALAMVERSPEHVDMLTQSVVDQGLDVCLKISLPAHRVDGGPGGGWVDDAGSRWPLTPGGAFTTAARLSSQPTVATVLRVIAYEAPVADAYCAVWSSTKKKFVHCRVKSSTSLGSFTYDVTLWSGVDISALYAGEYVSPDAEKLDDYGATWPKRSASLGLARSRRARATSRGRTAVRARSNRGGISTRAATSASSATRTRRFSTCP